MGYYSLKVVVVIFDLNFSDSHFLLFDLTDKGNFILFFYHFTAFSFHIGPIAITLFTILLNQTAKHKDGGNVIFLYHAVEVVECGGEGTLSSNDFLTLKFHDIRVDVILNLIFFLFSSEDWLGGIKSHDVWVSVVWELLGILIQFFEVILCLGHEGEYLELR